MSINLYSKETTDTLLTGKLSVTSLSNAATSTLNATAPTSGQALTYDGTDLAWATVGGSFNGDLNGQTLVNGNIDIDGFSIVCSGLTSDGALTVGDGFDLNLTNGSITLNTSGGITFTDSSVQTTAYLGGALTSDKALANAIAASTWYIYDTGTDWNRDKYPGNALVFNNANQGDAQKVNTYQVTDGTNTVSGLPSVISSLDGSQPWYVLVNGTASDFGIHAYYV